jgi:hypothetical protein
MTPPIPRLLYALPGALTLSTYIATALVHKDTEPRNHEAPCLSSHLCALLSYRHFQPAVFIGDCVYSHGGNGDGELDDESVWRASCRTQPDGRSSISLFTPLGLRKHFGPVCWTFVVIVCTCGAGRARPAAQVISSVSCAGPWWQLCWAIIVFVNMCAVLRIRGDHQSRWPDVLGLRASVLGPSRDRMHV